MTDSAGTASAVPISLQSESSERVCDSCGAGVGPAELFCNACGAIQPLASGIDYFRVFHLTRKLNLDGSALEREFYRLSRRLHPDVYARAGSQEQEWSLSNSSLLNDAYRTLKDPLKRTEYLLRLEGVLNADEGGARNEDRVPADLLEEVFGLNMQLDEMRSNKASGETDSQLQQDLLLAKQNFETRLESADATLRELWGKWDAALESGDPAEQVTAKTALAALLDRRRYLRNLGNSVDQVLEG